MNVLTLPSIYLRVVILGAFLLLSAGLIAPASAIVPEVRKLVVWSSGSDTVLNVTVYHTPAEDSFHYVYMIQVDISGDVRNFPISVPSTTEFTIPCNLGPIEGTPLATVRAICTFDGSSAWTAPIQVPEFSLLSLLLTLFLASTIAAFTPRKAKRRLSQ